MVDPVRSSENWVKKTRLFQFFYFVFQPMICKKKACWVPCSKNVCFLGEIRDVQADQITVFAGNKVR